MNSLPFVFQHSCLHASVNGRDGVIVAGGSSSTDPALKSVEFYDLEEGQWKSLGSMRQGRKYPGIFVLDGNLVMAGQYEIYVSLKHIYGFKISSSNGTGLM